MLIFDFIEANQCKTALHSKFVYGYHISQLLLISHYQFLRSFIIIKTHYPLETLQEHNWKRWNYCCNTMVLYKCITCSFLFSFPQYLVRRTFQSESTKPVSLIGWNKLLLLLFTNFDFQLATSMFNGSCVMKKCKYWQSTAMNSEGEDK